MNRGVFLMTEGKYSEAMALMRKGQKMDPRRPMAFFQMALLYVHTGNEADAPYYLEEATKKWALVAVTGRMGDNNNISVRYALDQWEMCVSWLTREYKCLYCSDRDKPNWYCQDDSLLKRITKCYKKLNIFKDPMDKEIYQWLRVLRAYTTTGIISEGKFNTRLPCNSLTKEVIQEAIEMYQEALNIGKDDDNARKWKIHIMALKCHLKTLTEETETHENDFSTGKWVYIQGLVNKTSLNGKCGRITNDTRPDNGRVPIQVKMGQNAILGKPENIDDPPPPQGADNKSLFALVSCLDESTEWAVMKTIVPINIDWADASI